MALEMVYLFLTENFKQVDSGEGEKEEEEEEDD